MQASIGLSDGERLWAIRYSTEGRSRTLFVSTNARDLRALYPDRARLQQLQDEDRVVISEPFTELPGAWQEIPESTVLIVQPGDDVIVPFRPHAQAGDVSGGATIGRTA